jgi:hypothetical protein
VFVTELILGFRLAELKASLRLIENVVSPFGEDESHLTLPDHLTTCISRFFIILMKLQSPIVLLSHSLTMTFKGTEVLLPRAHLLSQPPPSLKTLSSAVTHCVLWQATMMSQRGDITSGEK